MDHTPVPSASWKCFYAQFHKMHTLEESFVYQWLYNFLDDLVNPAEIQNIESQVNAVNFQTIL